MGEDFTDPGVTATDPEDGTLTGDSITISYSSPWFEPGPIEADTYSGLQLWLKADEGFSPGGWTDQSGNGRDATANGEPVLVDDALNGLPVMRYDGNQNVYHSWNDISDVRTVFWVVKRNSGDVFMLGDDNEYHFHSGGSTSFWHATYAHAHIRDGRLVVDSQITNGLVTPIPTKWSIISLRTTGNVEASRFTSDRTYGRQWVTREVEVFNPNAPVITLVGDAEMHHELGTDFTDPGITVADKDGGPLDETQAEVKGEVDGHSPGRYIIRYDFDDGNGNQAVTVYRNVEVSDTVAPEIELAGGESIKHPIGQPFIDPGYSANDLWDGAVTVQSSEFLYDRLLHRGWDDFGTQDSLNFTNNGGILLAQPDGQTYLTRPLYFNGDTDFVNAGVGITHVDQFR
ncbi:MAG: DUF5011 domain-containing protein, partial [Euryarchaeota archaeon]|nr:DUF5011 domain-containing protein [Euryarchaeota archaeon]